MILRKRNLKNGFKDKQNRKNNLFVIFFLSLWIFYSLFIYTENKYPVDSDNFMREYPVQLNEDSCLKNTSSREWKILCTNKETKVYAEASKRLISSSKFQVNIVQIGAHVGFERNDPLAAGIISLIDSFPQKYRPLFRWTFVEPSPPNYSRLLKNLETNSNICELRSINAGVIPDSENSSENDLVFYSLRDTIDPETGFDSLSKKKLPKFITQVSSFNKSPILSNENVFSSRGLNVNDYIVETKVPVKKFSALMDEILTADGQHSSPFIVLIDTEGFDCDIVQGISIHSNFLPKFLVFEINQCPGEKYDKTKKHLEKLGYITFKTGENAVAILKQKYEVI